jgi:NADPH2:quinone reductase
VEENVWPMIERGALRVVMDSEHALHDAPAAHWRIESGGHVGKIVLKVLHGESRPFDGFFTRIAG